jgi:hypothetical protein
MPNRISSSTIKRALKSFNYTYKKTFYHPKRDIIAREKFQEEITQIPQEKLVYLDESGIKDNACPLYGWSLREERCYGKKIYQHTRRVNIIAGLYKGHIITPVVFEGTL